MVRINLIAPNRLADQHLVAEYNEILMLLGYVRKNPRAKLEEIPQNYKLGKGHILFFKNKLIYLKKRHEKIKKEMIKRGFRPIKEVNLGEFDKQLRKDWKPTPKDREVIKQRLIEKINKKPDFYKYYGNVKKKVFWLKLIKNAN